MANRELVMLAQTLKETDNVTNWLMSEKLDGQRALVRIILQYNVSLLN